jgi:glutamate synthase domain-containing protein 2
MLHHHLLELMGMSSILVVSQTLFNLPFSRCRRSGSIHWRPGGPNHLHTPDAITKLQHAVRQNSRDTYQNFTSIADEESKKCVLRGMFKLKYADTPTPMEEVESAASIVKRFNTGAMSYGSISKETHEALAVGMNQVGGKSNTGEGGEHSIRWESPDMNSAIKQVASARFGVDIHYLSNAITLQIKICTLSPACHLNDDCSDLAAIIHYSSRSETRRRW